MTHTCTKVTVRQRAIRNDKISLYLDYYPAVRNPETMQMSRREYLGIYIYAHPKNEMEREFNNDMLNKAEAIRCIRVQSLINEEFGFLDKHKMKADFLAYFANMMRNKDQKWKVVYAHFSNFVQCKCTFGEVLPRKLEQKMEIVGEQIKLARLRRNLSVAQVAERATCSPLTVSRIEKGVPTVAIGIYLRVLYALQLDDDILWIAKEDKLGKSLQDLALKNRERASKKE